MAQRPSHRRNVAATPVDPTITTTTTTTTKHPHPHPDTTTTSTIQNISHRFSKLYANHKTYVAIANSLKTPNNNNNNNNSHSHPQPDNISLHKKTHVSNTSRPILSKSKSHHETNTTTTTTSTQKDINFSTNTKSLKDKKDSKKLFLQKYDVKKASQLMSKSLDGGRRRSFYSSQVELTDFFFCTGVKVVAVDMPPLMQIHAVNCARNTHDSLEKFTSKTLALTLKKEFDEAYGPAWHCIVGTSFGSFVTHSVGGFMYFSMDHKIYVLLFKTAVHKAE